MRVWALIVLGISGIAWGGDLPRFQAETTSEFAWTPALAKAIGPTLMVTLPPTLFAGVSIATGDGGVGAVFGAAAPLAIWDIYRRIEYTRTGEINGGGLGLFRNHASSTLSNLRLLTQKVKAAKREGCGSWFPKLKGAGRLGGDS